MCRFACWFVGFFELLYTIKQFLLTFVGLREVSSCQYSAATNPRYWSTGRQYVRGNNDEEHYTAGKAPRVVFFKLFAFCKKNWLPRI